MNTIGVQVSGVLLMYVLRGLDEDGDDGYNLQNPRVLTCVIDAGSHG
jgi:hypothetical protein